MLATLALSAALGVASPPHDTSGATTVTILYDAFGGGAGLERDWGFSALIEYQGKRILFDTGNNAAIFAQNVARLRVDLTNLDLVIISHRHTDHATGLSVVLQANPDVPVYAPREAAGIFGGAVLGTSLRPLPSLPDSMRYFAGEVPDQIPSGTLWPTAHFILVDSALTIAPGIRLVFLVSDTPGTRELREVSLVLSTPSGDILIVGCSHPGIERILAAAGARDVPLRALFGGLHLASAPDSLLGPLVQRLHDEWRIAQLAPGHCTGEPAFAAFKREYAEDYLYAGLGRRVVLQ